MIAERHAAFFAGEDESSPYDVVTLRMNVDEARLIHAQLGGAGGHRQAAMRSALAAVLEIEGR